MREHNRKKEQDMEKIINVPLDDETRALLDKKAKSNGRASSREAAQIIKDDVRKDAGNGKRK